MISLRQITYALAVEKSLHFKKAAEACAISQSALSTALSELEKQLEFEIFERDNKKVLITAPGKIFLEQARRIKLLVDDLYWLGPASKRPLATPMALGVIPTIGPYLLPKVLPDLRARFPELRLKIVEEQSHVLVENVRNGDIDTAILALPYPHDGLLAFEFWQEDFFWITHKDDVHGQQQEIAASELHQAKLMLLKDGHCLKDHALAACKLKSNPASDTLDSTSLYTLVQMVAGRMGTTLAPEMALNQLISNNPELRAVHLNEPGPHRRIAFIVRPNYAGVANIELLMQMFSKQLQASIGR
jgi:LysR family hydrogen peroxide-inducible transcriptional activator